MEKKAVELDATARDFARRVYDMIQNEDTEWLRDYIYEITELIDGEKREHVLRNLCKYR